MALGIDDEDISHERVRDDGPQRLDDLRDGRIGREDRRRRFHQPADRALPPVMAGEPLLALDLAGRERDLAPALGDRSDRGSPPRGRGRDRAAARAIASIGSGVSRATALSASSSRNSSADGASVHA